MGTRVAVDIGGTFTDLVYLRVDDSDVGLFKTSTTPTRFDEGVMTGVASARLDEVEFFAHGTTIVINTLTERTGAVTALLTTRGMRDVLEIQRGNRPDLYNLMFAKPRPFVPRRLRFEVTERVNFRGEILTALDEEDVRAAAHAASNEGAEAIAICFLHSYANPAHETRAAEIIHEVSPEVAVTTSAAVCGEWREYHRTSTAVLDAYVRPTVRGYFTRLGRRLEEQGIPPGLQFAMQSNGGISRFDVAADYPIHLVESGPVGGIIGAAQVGEAIDRPNLIALDIGGTTAKASLVEGGMLRLTSDYHIERTPAQPGYPVKVAVVDIVEIGAGGGSIAWLDPAGALKVGPKSAGADPGPAAYGRGGTVPTLSDANIIAGSIDPEYFLGGTFPLQPDLSRSALEPLAKALATTIEKTALGIIRIANASMVHLLRLVSVRRGRDPRDFALFAYGGGGPVHAATLARELHIPEVIIPRAPAHFSALGMLMTDVRHDLARTHVSAASDLDEAAVAAIWMDLEGRLLTRFKEEGWRSDEVTLVRSADMRYAGQEHTVTVQIPGRAYDAAARHLILEQFHRDHEQLYTFRLDVPVEFVNFRLAGLGSVRKPPLLEVSSDFDVSGALKGTRHVYFDDNTRLETRIYDRERLGAGSAVPGPAVIEEAATSTIVLPGMRAEVDPYGNLLLRMGR